MMEVRRASERGHFDYGWLRTYHTFSFGNYYDPQQMRFRHLRVMNEDFVQPGRGFGRHGHRDMEIVTYVLEGTLEHQDSLGHTEQLHAGEVQRMTAGSGIQHSEYNPSPVHPVHLYQIWIEPRELGLVPEYEQRTFDRRLRQGTWQLVASSDGRDQSMVIHQDVDLYLGELAGQQMIDYQLDGRDAWLQVLRGAITLGADKLLAGEGVAIRDEGAVEVLGFEGSEVMLFDFSR